ncbi:Pentatricopeptide repeat-containing protein At1g28690, mitochondrial [Linum grandiflorum]
MKRRNAVSWNSMIDGYVESGNPEEAMMIFQKMMEERIQPNHITFLCILSAFSHSGLVDEGMRFFDSMKNDYVLEPAMDHYGAVVELLGRAGRLKENLLFPALFVTYSYGVAMLSATLLQKAAQSVHFHPEWEKLSIVHLCFGDDLLEKVAWESVPLSINSIGSLD